MNYKPYVIKATEAGHRSVRLYVDLDEKVKAFYEECASHKNLTEEEHDAIAARYGLSEEHEEFKRICAGSRMFIYARPKNSFVYQTGFDNVQIISGIPEEWVGRFAFMSPCEALRLWSLTSDTQDRPSIVKGLLAKVRLEALMWKPKTRFAVCFTTRNGRDTEVTVDLKDKAVYHIHPCDGADAFSAFGWKFTRISEEEAVRYERKFGVVMRTDRKVMEEG